jgi:hypothetical protein
VEAPILNLDSNMTDETDFSDILASIVDRLSANDKRNDDATQESQTKPEEPAKQRSLTISTTLPIAIEQNSLFAHLYREKRSVSLTCADEHASVCFTQKSHLQQNNEHL